MPTLGYARVSTEKQDLEPQLAALAAAGAERIFGEKESGGRGDRPQLRKLLDTVSAGDVVVITRLDRLARSLPDLVQIVAALKERGAGLRSLKEAWVDTTTPEGRLMLGVLGSLAEWEREVIRSRIDEGRRRAKAAGKSLGRSSSLKPDQVRFALEQRAAGKSTREIGRVLGVSASTISRIKPPPLGVIAS